MDFLLAVPSLAVAHNRRRGEMWEEGGRGGGGAEVRLRWADEKKRVAIVSRGNRDANSETLCRHRN